MDSYDDLWWIGLRKQVSFELSKKAITGEYKALVTDKQVGAKLVGVDSIMQVQSGKKERLATAALEAEGRFRVINAEERVL